MAAELRLLDGWKREEAKVEAVVAVGELADAVEEAYAILAELPTKRLPRDVIDLRYRKAVLLIARAGIRARAAEAELRDLGGDIA